MAALDRSELEASSLADLHAVANQIGLDGFRRLRKAELVDAILARSGTDGGGPAPDRDETSEAPDEAPARREGARERPARRRRSARPAARSGTAAQGERRSASRGRREAEESGAEQEPEEQAAQERSVEGVVELLGNGSAFLRVEPPEPSDADVYISAAQVRRCELVSGDRVSGPVRTPRRSERYPSLVRIETINGAPADSVSEGTRYENLEAAFPNERLVLDAQDPTLKAIEWLTPLGLGSRALITGGARSGKSETLRRLLGVLAPREGLESTLVLSGVRPEELADWQGLTVAPVSALALGASADSQDQAVERAIETAKRVAARGGDSLVLIDSLDGLHPHVACRALAAARNVPDGGSLTIIATATSAFGGETTVIALDGTLTSTGRFPALDLVQSGTLRPELLVGEEGAAAIIQARAALVSES